MILKQIGKLVIFLSKKFGKFLVKILKKVLLRALITMLTVGLGAAIGVGGGIITLIIGAIAAAIGGIVGAVMGLFDEFTREYKASGSILKALGAGLLGILKGALAGVVFVLEKIISFVTFGLLDFDFASIIMDFDMGGMVRDVFQKIKDFIADFSISDALSSIGNLFSGDDEKVEGKYMGGSVTSGTPYIVGEQGPELFVPGASGSIVPNGAMGGSGAPIIVTNNKELHDKLVLLRNHGLRGRDICDVFAYNSRLDTLQAIVGNHYIKKIDHITDMRIKNAHLYDKKLLGISQIEIPSRSSKVKQVFHLYCIRVNQRDDLQKYLISNGIDAKIHYPIPMHLQPAAKDYGYSEGDFPIAEKLCKEVLSLPVHEFITEEQVNFTVEKIKEFYS